MKLPDRVYMGRAPNLVPECTYELPERDQELAEETQGWLRCHPLAYVFGVSDRFYRCPTCEQWTTGGGCDVRRLAESGDLDAARQLHEEREWPAGTGKATTALRGVKPDYRLVTFRHREI